MEQNELDFQELKKIITTRIRGIYQPPWAVAFSGGGMRAAAHIGVIKAFEENDIFPDMIAASSTGSIIAAAYGLGMEAEEILRFFIAEKENLLNIKRRDDLTRPLDDGARARAAALGADALESVLSALFGERDFSEMKAPCYIVATDLTHGKEAVFSQGSVAKACRAGMSIPGLFMPYVHEEAIIVDGFVINNLPANVLRENGAEIVLGINAHAGKNARAVSTDISDVFNATVEMLSASCMQAGMEESDLVIEPKMDCFAMFSADEESIRKMYETGYEAAMSKLDDIAALFVRNNS